MLLHLSAGMAAGMVLAPPSSRPLPTHALRCSAPVRLQAGGGGGAEGGGLFGALSNAAKGLGGAAMEKFEKEMSLAAMQDQALMEEQRITAEKPVLGDAKQLPDSFEDSITLAVESCTEAVLDGNSRLVVEFDTSAGDETYNLLSRSLKVVQPMLTPLADALAPDDGGIVDEAPAVEDGAAAAAAPQAAEPPPRVQLLFPDEGTAAYVRQNWGTDLPSRTQCGSMPRANLAPGCELLLLVAPQATEVPAVQRLLQQVAENAPSTTVLLVNPKLVDMQSTGYGLVGRELRTMVADQFTIPFALKSYPEGALYRVYPEGWTVWKEDAQAEGGYELKFKATRRPSGDEIDELIYGDDEEAGGGGGGGGLGAFIKGFQAM